MRLWWGILIGALVGGVLALALFAPTVCRKQVSQAGRGWLADTFGSGAGGLLGDLFDSLVAKV